MQLTSDQQHGKNVVEQGGCALITGGAGVGKSTLMREITDKNTLLCGPTGASALQIGGVTLSSLFSLPLGVCLPGDEHKPAPKAEKLFAEIDGGVKRIILDEISMVRGDQFSLMDARLRRICKRDIPMGGISLVAVGDFGQLNPVLTQKEAEIYHQTYKSPWAFDTLAWEMANFETVFLNEVIRQEDVKQQRMLQSIRLKDRWWIPAVDRINEISSPRPLDTIWLCAYNKTVNAINSTRFREHQGVAKTYTAKNKGFKPHEVPVEMNLQLKEGCRVLIKANDPNGCYINGTQGIVIGMEDAGVYVKTDTGREIFVESFEWSKFDYIPGLSGIERKKVASYKQIPIRLGYSISIHGSQGCTLDSANIDFGRQAFSAGMAYVALSRVKDLRKVYIQNGLQYADIIVDPAVQAFYKTLQENQ